MLVIEEDRVISRMIANDLEGIVEFSFASNWLEAVKLLREKRFQLVLIDLEVNDLPDNVQVFDFIHGIDLDYRILPIFKNDKVLVDERDRLMRSGIELALAKPWTKDELTSYVFKCLEA